jgi:hypothetical protein
MEISVSCEVGTEVQVSNRDVSYKRRIRLVLTETLAVGKVDTAEMW